MAKFVTIGERLSTTAPAVNKAFTERDPEPILKRAKQRWTGTDEMGCRASAEQL